MNQSREQLEALISAYLDNELTPEQRADVEALLSRDASARALLADFQAMRDVLQSLPRARASADMMEAIRARMERQALLGDAGRPMHQPRRAVSTAGRWAAAAAIVLMISAGGYFIWNLSSPESVAPNQQLAAVDRKPAGPQPVAPVLESPAPVPTASPLKPEEPSEAVADKRAPSEPMMLAEGHSGITVNQPAASAGRELKAVHQGVADANQEERYTGKSKSDALAANKAPTESSTPAATAGAPARPRATRPEPSARAQVVTVALGDAEAKNRLIEQIRSEALQVTDLDRSAARRAAGGKTVERIQPKHDVRRGTTPASELLKKVTRSRGRDNGRVTDLLVIVPDEKSREDLIKRLDRSGTGGGGYGYGGTAAAAAAPVAEVARADQQPALKSAPLRAETERMQESAADHWDSAPTPQTPGTASSPAEAGTMLALPQDSIVFRRGSGGGQMGAAAFRSAEGRPASQSADEARAVGKRAYGEPFADQTAEPAPAPNEAPAASKPSSLDNLGNAVWHWAASAVSRPAEETTPAAPAEPPAVPAGGEYVVRLHISVRPPGTEPAFISVGEPIMPTSEPAGAVKYDPSVLDLRAKTRPAPASRPASR